MAPLTGILLPIFTIWLCGHDLKGGALHSNNATEQNEEDPQETLLVNSPSDLEIKEPTWKGPNPHPANVDATRNPDDSTNLDSVSYENLDPGDELSPIQNQNSSSKINMSEKVSQPPSNEEMLPEENYYLISDL